MRPIKCITLFCLLASLTACKIDLSIIGLGTVATDSGSINCSTTTSATDCHQEYVTAITDCTGYDAQTNPTPPNCTVVATATTETFNALPGDNSSFGGWGDICFGAADLSCTHTITSEYAADPNGQLNVTATFDPEPAPQDASYTYNHLGQRASKTVAGVKTYFVYSDIDGQLLGEYTSTGAPIREYIYLEGERVAMYDYTGVEPKDSTGQKAIVYFHNDQVGQVQFAFNSNGQMIYERIQTPFGEIMGEMNVYNVQVPVRFPGQYYDSETGFNQNWNRDYDPGIGRYVQSDPIGLSGGINTYGYVMQNPLMFVDPEGMDAVGGAIGGGTVGGGSYGGFSGTGSAQGSTQGVSGAADAAANSSFDLKVSGCFATGCAGFGTDKPGVEISVPFPPQIGGGVSFCITPPPEMCARSDTGDSFSASTTWAGVSASSSGQVCVSLGPSVPAFGWTGSRGNL